MRFFRKSPAPRPMQAHVHHPWNPPEAELPSIVPINTLVLQRSEQTAIAITGISAYSAGFEISVTQCFRPGSPASADLSDTPRERFAALQSFQLGMQLSDRSTVTSGGPGHDSEPAGPILQLRGGGGTLHSRHSQSWAWPLPPAGPLEFFCQWPMFGITETRVRIDAQLILDAARQSIRLWPEHEG